jgi:hypothetical protein
MSGVPKDAERERRIENEVVVDAYGEEERAMGWYYYLESHLRFPFVATCAEHRIAPAEGLAGACRATTGHGRAPRKSDCRPMHWAVSLLVPTGCYAMSSCAATTQAPPATRRRGGGRTVRAARRVLRTVPRLRPAPVSSASGPCHRPSS